MKTADLTGNALDWAVAKSNGWINYTTDSIEQGEIWHIEANKAPFGEVLHKSQYHPSTDWARGGPIIEREKISIAKVEASLPTALAIHPDCWCGHIDGNFSCYGTTPLEAAMRCYVASKLGNDIDIPKEIKQ